jgi:hypothetical protein
MASKSALLTVEDVQRRIHLVRGQRVILDADLARFYGVTTSRFNEAITRNSDRFPEDFRFRLTKEELAYLISQNAISKSERGGRRTMPWVFTEHGALMAAGVLNSQTAVRMSVSVIRGFVRLRELLSSHQELAAKLNELEHKLEGHDSAIANLFEAMRQLLASPDPEHNRKIGFHPGNR